MDLSLNHLRKFFKFPGVGHDIFVKSSDKFPSPGYEIESRDPSLCHTVHELKSLHSKAKCIFIRTLCMHLAPGNQH